MIQSEVSILRRVKHPNIVLLIEEMDTGSELYLIMELVKVLNLSFHATTHFVFRHIEVGIKSCNVVLLPSPGR